MFHLPTIPNHSSSSKVDDAVRAADQKDERDRRRRSRSRERDSRGGGSGRGDDRRDLREEGRGGDRDRDGRGGGGDYTGPRGRGGDSRAGMGRRGDSRDRYGDLRGPPPRGGGGYDRDGGRYGPGPGMMTSPMHIYPLSTTHNTAPSTALLTHPIDTNIPYQYDPLIHPINSNTHLQEGTVIEEMVTVIVTAAVVELVANAIGHGVEIVPGIVKTRGAKTGKKTRSRRRRRGEIRV